MSLRVSIIVITRNRAAHLREFLRSISGLVVPPGMGAELVVVDNASTDETKPVIESTRLPQMPLRYLYESKKGKSNALNTALAAAGGFVLFTDDDVRVSANWLAGLTEPMVSGRADAVTGRVILAPNLVRDWMTPLHRDWLADFTPNTGAETFMIGSSMGVSREVLNKVPGFDPELGPGKLGFGDDSLFSKQILAAGFRVLGLPQVAVEHHPDPSRLQRVAWLQSAVTRGRSKAYLDFVWYKELGCSPLWRVWQMRAYLWAWRMMHPKEVQRLEGCIASEMAFESNLSFHLHTRKLHFGKASIK